MINEPTGISYDDNYVAFCYKGKRIVVRFVEGEKITMDVHKCIEKKGRMKTYKSYHEAKKDNPNKNIITSNGLFAVDGYQKFSFSKDWILCDPSDYEPKETKTMINKVKPFYIKITDDMTPQMVQDAFDKCVDSGVVAQDGIKNTNMKHKYNDLYHLSFKYVGVDCENNTYTTIDTGAYGESAKEITLDQLDEWLGLEVEQEWNGEELPPVGVECEILDINGNKVIGSGTIYHVDENKFFILSKSLKDYPEDSTVSMFDGVMNLYVMWVNDGDNRFRKPESPEQKAERERLEYIMYIDELYGNLSPECKENISRAAREIIDKTNYRKQ